MTKPITLLSFLGGNRGKDSKRPVYEQANYRFPDGSEVCSDYFAEAIVRSGQFQLKQVLLLGTRTSVWERLVQEVDLDLASAILERTDGDTPAGVTDEQLHQVERLLAEQWGMEVHAYAGELAINESNALDELVAYDAMLAKIPDSHEVLFDFTHGFRSLAMLLTVALRFRGAIHQQHHLRTVRLIYGEFSRDAPSPVHVLDDLWKGLQVSQAAQLFLEKFAGEELAEMLELDWPVGAKAIRKLSERVQSNLFLEFEEPLRQLHNALNNLPQPCPDWLAMLAHALEHFHHRLTAPTLSGILLRLAELLMEHHLAGQAYTALDEALTEIVLMAHGKESRNLTDDDRRQLFRETVEQLPDRRLAHQLWRIHNTRNTVAHAGRKIHRDNPGNAVAPGRFLHEFHGLAERLRPLAKNPRKLLEDRWR
ncbi:MAG TPA: TIGR02221 family CRISPR-associated protein [Deltaproteobacteria bacterium]|nr:TIGR02221 family CRISPR-associated protein [Deltaproteobacteria bacterium]